MRKNLKALRIKHNLTQEQIANQIGISRAYYTNIEIGRNTPSLDISIKIKEVLNYKSDDLFLKVTT